MVTTFVHPPRVTKSQPIQVSIKNLPGIWKWWCIIAGGKYRSCYLLPIAAHTYMIEKDKSYKRSGVVVVTIERHRGKPWGSITSHLIFLYWKPMKFDPGSYFLSPFIYPLTYFQPSYFRHATYFRPYPVSVVSCIIFKACAVLKANEIGSFLPLPSNLILAQKANGVLVFIEIKANQVIELVSHIKWFVNFLYRLVVSLAF